MGAGRLETEELIERKCLFRVVAVVTWSEPKRFQLVDLDLDAVQTVLRVFQRVEGGATLEISL